MTITRSTPILQYMTGRIIYRRKGYGKIRCDGPASEILSFEDTQVASHQKVSSLQLNTLVRFDRISIRRKLPAEMVHANNNNFPSESKPSEAESKQKEKTYDTVKEATPQEKPQPHAGVEKPFANENTAVVSKPDADPIKEVTLQNEVESRISVTKLPNGGNDVQMASHAKNTDMHTSSNSHQIRTYFRATNIMSILGPDDYITGKNGQCKARSEFVHFD